MDNTSLSKTIYDLNEEHIKQLIVPIVFWAILLIIGVPGNFTVLLIYGRKYSKCVYRSIIWNLAVTDLSFCTIGIPFNIARVVNYYTFNGNWTCKIFTAVLIFGINYSTNLLMLLSLHRFRQVCMPLKEQITIKTTKYWLIGCFVLALLLSWPQAVLQEMEYPMLKNNLTGQICPVTSSNQTVYWMVNNIFLLVLFFIYTFVLFFIYSLIGWKVYSRRKKIHTNNASEISEKGNDFSNKLTQIALTISVVFAVSYLPLFLLKVIDPIDDTSLDPFTYSLLRLTERSYIVNHTANPFIYAIFDNRFRAQFKDIATLTLCFERKQDRKESKSGTTQSSTSEPTKSQLFSCL